MNEKVIIEQGGLSKVTPSAWLTLRQCPWRVLLARYYKEKPLLPSHPNAILGRILHTALEKVTKGELTTNEAFNVWWEKVVSQAEQELINKGWGQFVPLKENTRHFGLKKIQVRNRLKNHENRSVSYNSGFSKAVEQKLASSDGLLTGQLDCIIWRNDQVEIRDYKTGAITTQDDDNEHPKVKEEYELQMKLYACLFHEHYGYFPNKLVLEDLNGKEYEVYFTEKESSILLAEIQSTLSLVNQNIARGESDKLAKTGDHCVSCQNRPVCSKYIRYLENPSTYTQTLWMDITGILMSVSENMCGEIILALEKDGDLFSVTGFELARLSEVNAMINQKVAIFNVKQAGVKKYASTKFSDIYVI